MAEISISTSGRSPTIDEAHAGRFDGADGGSIRVQTGAYVSTGDGSDGDLNASVVLGHGTTNYYRQVAPLDPHGTLEIIVMGQVTIHTQLAFRPTRVVGLFEGGLEPRLIVRAGHPLEFDPSTGYAVPKPHRMDADFRASQEKVDERGESIDGGEVEFVTIAAGDMNVDLNANGSAGRSGGRGGDGGLIQVSAARHGSFEGSPTERPGAKLDGVLRANGGRGGEYVDGVDPANANDRNGGDGGNGGAIYVTAGNIGANIYANGSSGSLGAPARALSETGDVAWLNGSHGGNGGTGGRIAIAYESLGSNDFSALGGNGAWGTSGRSPGGYFELTDPLIGGGNGGNGGNGGAGGTVLFWDRTSNQDVTLHDLGGNGGDGRDGGFGSEHQSCKLLCYPIAGPYVFGPGGNGGDGGSVGRSGELRGTLILDSGVAVDPREPPTQGEVGQGMPVSGVDGSHGDNVNGSHPRAPRRSDLPPRMPADQWTVMVYVAADTNIEGSLIDTINHFEEVDLTAVGVNVFVQLDRHQDYAATLMPTPQAPMQSGHNWWDTRRGVIIYDGDQERNATVWVRAVEDVATSSELNTGDSAPLTEFVTWAKAQAPAQRHALIMRGHGGGWRGLAHDQVINGYADRLTAVELGKALGDVGGNPSSPAVDLLVLETCQTQTIEMLAELTPADATYVIGFQPNVVGGFLHHHQWLANLRDTPTMERQELGRQILEAVRDVPWVPVFPWLPLPNRRTLHASMVEVADLPELIAAVRSFADAMLDTGTTSDWAYFRVQVANTETFGEQNSFFSRDLGTLMQAMNESPSVSRSVRAAAQRVVSAVERAVSHRRGDTYGLSIWAPPQGHKKALDEWFKYSARENFRFVNESRWGEVVAKVLNPRPFSILRILNDEGAHAEAAIKLLPEETEQVMVVESSATSNWYHLVLRAGEGIYVDVVTDGSASEGVLSVLAPDAQTVLFQQPMPDGAARLAVAVPAAGDYLLRVDFEALTANVLYSLKVARADSTTLSPHALMSTDHIETGVLLVDQPTVREVIIENRGMTPLTIHSVEVIEGAAAFHFQPSEPIDEPLGFGHEFRIPVVVAASQEGTHLGRLRITTNDPLRPVLDVELRAEVREPTLAGPLDYGDAPDSEGHPTVLASDGARHQMLEGFYLGSGASAEADGQPTFAPNATGDDFDDGVHWPSSGLPAGLETVITVMASAAGRLDAWIDFDGDGQWVGGGERVFFNEPLQAGENQLRFWTPSDISDALVAARFRFSSAGALLPTGLAADGEVEDYLVRRIMPPLWQNVSEPADVNADDTVNILDVLLVVHHLREYGVGHLLSESPTTQPSAPPYVDPDGNGSVNLTDLLAVVQAVRTRLNHTEGEGESRTCTAAARFARPAPAGESRRP